MRDDGMSMQAIADKYGVSRTSVHNWVKGEETNPARRSVPIPVTESEDVVTDIVRKKRKNNFPSGMMNAAIENTSKAEMQQVLTSVLRWYKQPLVKSDEECAERLENFFRSVTEAGELPTVEKMAMALGVTRAELWNWENGVNCSPVRTRLIKRAKDMMAAIDAELVSTGKIPQVPYIFRAKNYYGMRDQTDVVVTPNNPLGVASTAEDIATKYAELPDE